MNQQTTHTLRSIFRELPNFAPNDPRWRHSWQEFKRDYLAIPKPARAAYIKSLRKEADNVRAAFQIESVKQ